MIGHPKPPVREKPAPKRIARGKSLKRTKLKAGTKRPKRTTAYHRPEWLALARKVRKRSSGWCEMCQRENATTIHHKSYADFKGWKRLMVPMDQLIDLCYPCHKAQHPEERR